MGEVVVIEGTVVVRRVQNKYPYVIIYVRRGKERLMKHDGAVVGGLLVVEDRGL